MADCVLFRQSGEQTEHPFRFKEQSVKPCPELIGGV